MVHISFHHLQLRDGSGRLVISTLAAPDAGGAIMGILSPSRAKESHQRHPYHQVRTGSDAGDQPSAAPVSNFEIEASVIPMAHEHPSPPLRNRCRTPFLKKPMSVVTAVRPTEGLARGTPTVPRGMGWRHLMITSSFYWADIVTDDTTIAGGGIREACPALGAV